MVGGHSSISTTNTLLCFRRAGLRAAAATALKALAASGRSTVFFDNDTDSEPPSGGCKAVPYPVLSLLQ